MSIPKFAAENANKMLERLDKIAETIQNNYQAWGMPFNAAKAIVNAVDATADDIEKVAFGSDSFQARQAELITSKTAKVIQQDPDEKYMKTFANPMAPIQTEGDEKYMKAYSDDQSSAVQSGKSTTGKPLAP